MDKSRKLRRYRRKDYSQVIEFPVEIIGRDGVVRRYSFEESVRLYQRRIASADIRYADGEVARAEQAHCQHRIDQLRRSYFAHFGWPEIGIIDGPDETDGRMSGEVAAFLRRCLSETYPDLGSIGITYLEQRDHHQAFHLQPPAPVETAPAEEEGRFLLYVYRFAHTTTCASRDEFFEFVKVLDSLRDTATHDVEVLIAFHHTSDCGLILTGTRDVVPVVDKEALIEELELSWADESSQKRTGLIDEALVLVRRGLYDESLERFVAAYTQQNYSRVAYLGAAAIADLIAEDEEAETAAIMGTRYFPGDPALTFHLALSHLRLGRPQQAKRLLQGTTQHHRSTTATEMLQAIVCLCEGGIREGTLRLKRLKPQDLQSEPHLERARRFLLAQLQARHLVRHASRLVSLGSAFLILAAPAAESVSMGVWGVALCSLGVIVHIGIHRAWQRQFRELITGPRDGRLSLTSLSALQWPQKSGDVQ